jgi:hypothetical protein
VTSRVGRGRLSATGLTFALPPRYADITRWATIAVIAAGALVPGAPVWLRVGALLIGVVGLIGLVRRSRRQPRPES